MEKKRGIPNGTLWGLLILVGYIWSYIGLGLWLVWKSAIPGDFAGWFRLIGSSFAYILAGYLGLFSTILIAIYFVVRDRSVAESVRNNWPIIGALLYVLLPVDLPGPIDDAVVMALAGGLRAWFWVRGKKMLEDANGSVLLSNEEVLSKRKFQRKFGIRDRSGA